ncbi:MAG: carbohydrate kinase family protein [Anaerolineae bacterium]|nr:carbohydrate kinase family protein [Anaerolineae bacterium]
MVTPIADVFVIGTASLDVLHLADGRTARTAGGAGLYTALAARQAGARTGLYAPKPQPIPEPLQPAADRLDWRGPTVAPADLPRLAIAHHGHGRATLLNTSWGAEAQLTPAALPAEVGQARYVHLAALSSAQRQLDFLLALTPHPGLISVGTYARLVYNEAETVRRLFERADLFFMNENEANGLFGRVDQARTRPGALLFVTLDAAGALVIEGDQVTRVPGRPVPEVDPTGAGDTFCGATLAGLAQGLSPTAAAQQAVQLAAQTVGAVGPAALVG